MIRQLNINNYETHFILGHNPCEKMEKRRVILNINIRFLDNIFACHDDRLDNTICYSSLLSLIEERLKNVDFNLIERAAQCLYDTIFERLKNDKIMIRVEVIKPVPIENLESSSFICSDW